MTYIIVDLEATCCNKNSFPRNEMETIEIGAVALIGNGPNIISEYSSFIKPVRHPALTEFCTSLTSIEQRTVDEARGYKEVLTEFSEWAQQFENPIFCSWGYYDKKQLLQDCTFHGKQFPFSDEHINIKNEFAKNTGLKKGIGLGKALKMRNLKFEGRAHRGIDDARNMARLSEIIFK